MATYVIVGVGATGLRVARHLRRGAHNLALDLFDDDGRRATQVAQELGGQTRGFDTTFDPSLINPSSVVVLAGRAGSQIGDARLCVDAGAHVVAVSDRLDEVEALLDLDEAAKGKGVRVVVGAGMMPGLSDVLAAHGRRWFDEVSEIHVSKFGTGGPDCARQHHSALSRPALDWRDGWQRRPGGSGRELAWFPEPVEAADCYRAELPDPLLLVRRHPKVTRVTARVAATRRDRLTMHLPMLRRPHAEGLLGAVRVELRGLSRGAWLDLVLGCSERPAVVAAAVASTAAQLVHPETQGSETLTPGARGLAEYVDPLSFLRTLRSRGLRQEIFVGPDDGPYGLELGQMAR